MKVSTREREEAMVMLWEAGLAGEPNANVSGTQERQEEEEGEGGGRAGSGIVDKDILQKFPGIQAPPVTVF